MLEIREVKTKREQRQFLNFPLKLYKNSPYFVPPLYMDEKQIFNPHYHYYEQSEAVYYNAYLDGKMVGRISGILQKASNEKWNQKRVRFTRFDCIDNQDVANALFKAVEDYAKSKDMDEVVGPLGFSDFEREGLLIEGFNELSTYCEQYNYDYYPKLVENCGYGKEIDWVERQIRAPKEPDPRIEKIGGYLMKKYHLHFGTAKNTSAFLKKYGKQFFDIVETTYENIYGTVPFTQEMRKQLIKGFKIILNKDNLAMILDENEKVVCFGLCFPFFGQSLQKSGGKINPISAIRILRTIKHPKNLELGLIGVLPEYQKRGVNAILLSFIMKFLTSGKYEFFETNLNLEDNNDVQSQWRIFDARLHKRRRSYIKKIKEEN